MIPSKCAVMVIEPGRGGGVECTEPVVSEFERLVTARGTIDETRFDDYWQPDLLLCAKHEKSWLPTITKQGYRRVKDLE